MLSSHTQDWRRHHKIAHDGYNVGRDLLVEKATSGSHYLGRSWEATVEWVEGLLEPGNRGAPAFLRASRRSLIGS